MEERFWVERPADLVALPTPHRSEVAAYNDAAKLVIVAAIVLAALRYKAWAIVLAVGLALVMFVYYNRHPRAQDAQRDERKGAMFQTRQQSSGQGRRAVTDASVEPFTRVPLEPLESRPRLPKTPAEGRPGRRERDLRFRDGSSTGFDRRAWSGTVTFVGRGKPAAQAAVDTFALRGSCEASGRGRRVEGVVHSRADEPLLHYYDTLEEDRAHIERELAVEEQTNESAVHG
jgi:hypothetical protein